MCARPCPPAGRARARPGDARCGCARRRTRRARAGARRRRAHGRGRTRRRAPRSRRSEPSAIARVHAHQVLEEDPPRPDRQMADLGVPHLTGREPHRLAGRLDLRVREARPEVVEHGRPRKLDRVPWPGRRDPPAVEDHQRDEREASPDAARQIAANESGSSEAPPTSAPSTSGCASSSAAFSGLTEPP